MAHEKERKLLFDYRDFINDLYNGRWLTEAEKHTYLEHVEKFLSTLPEEKEKKAWISVKKWRIVKNVTIYTVDESNKKY